MINQQELNEYFSTIWLKQRGSDFFNRFELTGWKLLEHINPGEWVLDVGCAGNFFKDKIENLVGIDPAFDEADYKVSIEDFETEQRFDVAFCLGSINFGDEDIITRQIAKVLSLLKPKGRIYWRCNPGLYDHGNEECKKIPLFPWSLEKHVKLSEQFNCQLIECRWDKSDRIYAVWQRRVPD